MNTQKTKKHINIIDALIIIAVIAIVAFAANIVITDLFNDASSDITYVIRVMGVLSDDINSVSAGDKIFAGKSNTFIGTVSEVSSAPAVRTVFSYDSARFTETALSEIYDLYITVSANAPVVNNSYTIGDISISANTCPGFTLPFRYEKAEIISVKSF